MEEWTALASAYFKAATAIFPPAFWLDVFKSLVGACVGAGIAFWFALRKDYLTRMKERKAAGNLAVITLLQYTDEYMRTKAVLEGFKRELLKVQPNSPPWMFIKPMHVTYSENLRFNLDALVFLLEQERGADLIQHLLSAERKYHDFFGLLKVHATASEELQKRLSDAKIDPNAAIPAKALEGAVGFQLSAKTESFVRGVFNHFEGEDTAFQDACKVLPEELRNIFGKKGVIRIELPSAETLEALARKDLPDFPAI